MEQPSQKKRSPAVYLALGILIGVVILALIVVVPKVWLKPKPEIVSLNGYDGFQGLNYAVFLDVTVKNHGADGEVVVYAEINGAGKYEKQDRTIYLESGETRTIKFTFDVSFWRTLFSQITYRAWAVPK